MLTALCSLPAAAPQKGKDHDTASVAFLRDFLQPSAGCLARTLVVYEDLIR